MATIEQEVPDHLDIHLVLDNSSTHKTPEDQTLAAGPPSHHAALHPDLKLMDEPRRVVVRGADQQKLRRSAHTSVRQPNTDIRAWIKTWNDDPRPYIWTKTADQILDSIAGYCQRINDSGH